MQPAKDPTLPDQSATLPAGLFELPANAQDPRLHDEIVDYAGLLMERFGGPSISSLHKTHYAIPFDIHGDTDGGKHHPKTVVEMRMCAMSHTIREKPRWWEKIKDPEIVAQWRKEVLEQQGAVDLHRQLSGVMVDYVLDELHGYAALRDEETGIEAGPFEQIWKSDGLIPEDLRERLKAAVALLENVPDSEKDWHPGSNGQVLDLVHPSLYPIVYGRTLVQCKDTTEVVAMAAPSAEEISPMTPMTPVEGLEIIKEFISKRFQWLPSDFTVSNTGKVSLSSPYINNLHPVRHADLYAVILEIIERAIPMFERVLSDLRRPLLPMRIKTAQVGHYPSAKFESAPCLWDDDPGIQPYLGFLQS